MKLVIVAIAATLAGCGGAKLSTDEHLEVVSAEVTIRLAPCEDFYESNAWSLSGFEEENEKALERAEKAVDLLVDFYREDPDALAYYGDGDDKSVRQVVTDAANSLDDCNPDLARRLDREL